jgi:hypothetical protein
MAVFNSSWSALTSSWLALMSALNSSWPALKSSCQPSPRLGWHSC